MRKHNIIVLQVHSLTLSKSDFPPELRRACYSLAQEPRVSSYSCQRDNSCQTHGTFFGGRFESLAASATTALGAAPELAALLQLDEEGESTL